LSNGSIWISLARFSTACDHRVYQSDDGRLARHVAEMFEIILVAGLEARCRGASFTLGEVSVDRVDDLLLGCELWSHFEPGERANRIHGLEVERIGHGQRQRAVLDRQWEDQRLPQKPRRHTLGLRARSGRCDLRDGKAQLLRKGRDEIALRKEAHVDENLADLISALALQFQRSFQILRANEALVDQ